MNDHQVAAVCWVRAVEQGVRDGVPWTAADAAWAGEQARRALGEGASGEAFIARRAEIAQQRLAERDAAWRLPWQGRAPRAWRALLIAGALALAALIVGNVIGPSQRINLLAPPILALLLWNLLVYAVLPFLSGRGPSAWLADAIDAARVRWPARGVAAPLVTARARFGAEWLVATRGVQQRRVAAVLHGSAALLALVVIASMYLFGLAFDVRAGWDSTWLDAEQVEQILRIVFAPAAMLSGQALPDAAELARLRFADGSAGERASRWIHLYAITLGLVVVVPRLLLAAWAAFRARRAAATLRLPLDEPYFRALLREAPARARPISVLPYSYTLSGAHLKALPRVLAEAFGSGAQPRVLPALPLGAEDALAQHLRTDEVERELAVLFAASATPERETHGAALRALAALLKGRELQVLVDESGLRERVGNASDAELRLTQRRAAWQRMLHDLSLPAPRFVDLR